MARIDGARTRTRQLKPPQSPDSTKQHARAKLRRSSATGSATSVLRQLASDGLFKGAPVVTLVENGNVRYALPGTAHPLLQKDDSPVEAHRPDVTTTALKAAYNSTVRGATQLLRTLALAPLSTTYDANTLSHARRDVRTAFKTVEKAVTIDYRGNERDLGRKLEIGVDVALAVSSLPSAGRTAWRLLRYLRATPAMVERIGLAATAEAGSASALERGAVRTIRAVNPRTAPGNRVTNCINCAIATDHTLAGTPACARAAALGSPATPITRLTRFYQRAFGTPQSLEELSAEMLRAGPGARGIVFGFRPGGNHVFNVINQRGTILFLDGQSGGVANTAGYRFFQLLRTN